MLLLWLLVFFYLSLLYHFLCLCGRSVVFLWAFPLPFPFPFPLPTSSIDAFLSNCILYNSHTCDAADAAAAAAVICTKSDLFIVTFAPTPRRPFAQMIGQWSCAAHSGKFSRHRDTTSEEQLVEPDRKRRNWNKNKRPNWLQPSSKVVGKRALKVRVNYYYIHLRLDVSVCLWSALLLLLWMAAISVPIFEIFEYFVFQLFDCGWLWRWYELIIVFLCFVLFLFYSFFFFFTLKYNSENKCQRQTSNLPIVVSAVIHNENTVLASAQISICCQIECVCY